MKLSIVVTFIQKSEKSVKLEIIYICLEVYKDHGTYEQNPLLRRLSLSQIFLETNRFDSKNSRIHCLCLSEKEGEVDRFDEIVKVHRL